MTIQLENIGKKFNYHWIFRSIHLEIGTSEKIAILGGNGSGKSTLLQVIAGLSIPSEGKVIWKDGTGKELQADEYYRKFSICAPYTDIHQELTLNEMLTTHFSFKNLLNGIKLNEIPELLELKAHINKKIYAFSSGMRQRLKLGLCLYSQSDIVLLDEPLVNLDAYAADWYKKQIEFTAQNRLFIVCSNHDAREYFFAENRLDLNKTSKA
jgi:ABC-type multidrug transport system ATPase subunit